MNVIGTGSILSAFLSALCCLGPLIFATLGVAAGTTGFLGDTARFASGLIPYRPLFIVLTFLFLGMGFFSVYRRKGDCATDSACPTKVLKGTKTALWIVSGIAITLVLMPYILAIGS